MTAALSEPTFPYVAYVSVSGANVHSGPGQRHYPTTILPAGTAVQVYRHDSAQPEPDSREGIASPSENKWCAIRPPVGSISWIDSRQVRKLPGGMAEILESQTLARVGSQLSIKQNAVQVALSPGERVKLSSQSTSSQGQWLAIEPPAGEFRWILASHLSRQPSQKTQGIQQNVPQGQSLWKSQHEARVARRARQESRQSTIDARPFATSHSIQSQANVTTTGNFGRSTDKSIQIITGSPADLMLVQSQQLLTSGFTSPIPAPATGPLNSIHSGTPHVSPPRIHLGGLTTNLPNRHPPVSGQAAMGSGQETMGQETMGQTSIGPPLTDSSETTPATQNHFDRLGELQVRLSLMVVQDPRWWQFEQIRQEANLLLTQADASALRGKTRDFLDQITLFERVRSRRIEPTDLFTRGNRSPTLITGQGESIDSSGDTTDTLSTRPPRRQLDMRQRVQNDLNDGRVTSLSTGNQSADLNTTLEGVRYDAVGVLKPVISRREHSPRYALVDDDGKVVSFVTPTTDVNLQPYIGRRIGVNGTRGFMPEYRRAHVIANRVTPIMR